METNDVYSDRRLPTTARNMDTSDMMHALDGILNFDRKIEILFTAQQIAERVAALGAEITRDFAGESLVMVGVLKGAAPFLTDLSRAVRLDATFDFVSVSSYGNGERTSGAVLLKKDLDASIEGKNVLIVEDILDSGLTLAYLHQLFMQQQPRALRIATLLDKHTARAGRLEAARGGRLEADYAGRIEADYVGFSIPDQFVVGYGMDFAEHFRNLPDICILSSEKEQPEKE